MAPPSMHEMHELYQDYAFIDPPVVPSGAGSVPATGLAGAMTYINRTYEEGKWYFIVFKPFDRAYEKNPIWYLTRGLEKCSNYILNPQFAMYTREKQAKKVHINGLLCSRIDLSSVQGKNYCNKYKIHIDELETLGDRRRVLEYICKEESTDNTWSPFIDYRMKLS